MRSFDRSMPEELNRVLTDHASDLLLCSTQTAMDNLAREGVRGETHLVGDVMADVSLAFREIAAERSTIVADLGLEPGAYLVVTAHRAGNVDDPARLERLVELLEALPRPVVFPLHPRTRARLEAAGLLERLDGRDAGAAARLPRLPRAGPPRARDPDRLGRRAEGGLPAGRAVRDASATRPNGSRPSRRAGTCLWTSTVSRAWLRLERTPPAERPELYGGGHAAERVRDVVSAYTARL